MTIAIIGLGNPGPKYQNTRHNLGFRVIDQLAKKKELSPVGKSLGFELDKKLKAEVAETHYKEIDLILVKPQTFVNDSGSTVQKVKEKYGLELNNIWVVCDDLDLPVGTVRARTSGRSGGHNGLKDIINQLDSNEFSRIRVGIKQQSGEDIDNEIEAKKYVLTPFTKREEGILKTTLSKASQYIIQAIEDQEITNTTIT